MFQQVGPFRGLQVGLFEAMQAAGVGVQVLQMAGAVWAKGYWAPRHVHLPCRIHVAVMIVGGEYFEERFVERPGAVIHGLRSFVIPRTCRADSGRARKGRRGSRTLGTG